MRKILLLGYLGLNTNQLDGQTVKTRNIYNLLNDKIGSIDKFDTQDFQLSKFAFFNMIKKICQCKMLVYLPAHGNFKYLFPFIFILSKLFRFKIYYVVVGGWLPTFIKNLPIHRYMLKRIVAILPQTALVVQQLKQLYNINNVQQFNNFRITNFAPQENHTKGELKVVFMARITKIKGIDSIFNISDAIEKYNGKISIDFYGQVDKADKEFFYTGIEKSPFYNYCGVVEPENIYQTLEKYDVMVLPTHYTGEGFPGSILDAYISGIPVIATKWTYADEFIDDSKSGFVIPFTSCEDELLNKIVYLYENEDILSKLKKYTKVKREKYHYETAWEELKSILNITV